MLRILVAGALCAMLCGCGAGAPPCTLLPVANVGPVSATANHLAKAPGNQQQFSDVTTFRGSSANCPVPQLATLNQPAWTVSDPVNVSMSSAKDATNGLATCLGATKGAVTITAQAVGTTPAATASLTANDKIRVAARYASQLASCFALPFAVSWSLLRNGTPVSLKGEVWI